MGQHVSCCLHPHSFPDYSYLEQWLYRSQIMPLCEHVGDLYTGELRRTTPTSIPYVVHCVSRDFKMWAGFAVSVRHRVKETPTPFCTKTVPSVATQRSKDGSIMFVHLVTKERYNHKPRQEDVFDGIAIIERTLPAGTPVNAPRIACGLDGLSWVDVAARLHRSPLEWNVWCK